MNNLTKEYITYLKGIVRPRIGSQHIGVQILINRLNKAFQLSTIIPQKLKIIKEVKIMKLKLEIRMITMFLLKDKLANLHSRVIFMVRSNTVASPPQ